MVPPNAPRMITSDAEIERRLRPLLREQPLGLLLDIDGTISPIADTPGAAFVPPETRARLNRLVADLALVAAISGRAAADAATMVAVEGMVFVGNHGLEVARAGLTQPLPEAAQFRERVQLVLERAQAELAIPGLLFEDKGITASVHYRLAADPTAAGAAVGHALGRLAAEHGLRLTPGRMVWEIRPPVVANKGTAVRWLIEEYRLRGAIFCGDDRTDVDAFDALRELRDQGLCQTLNVGVLAPETPAVVRERADLLVEGTEGVERLLALLANGVRHEV